MRNDPSSFVPKHRPGIVREVADEFIIYDEDTHTAHCLNKTAAQVWQFSDGKKTVTQIARAMEQDLKSPVEEDLVWVTLRKLAKSGLLINRENAEISLSRRALLGKLKVAAFLAVPVVTSIIVPTPAEAASPCRHNGKRCPQGNRQCCDGFCFGGFCIGG
jgi:Coenzyme PQQ synthesis protein D (PqqD)